MDSIIDILIKDKRVATIPIMYLIEIVMILNEHHLLKEGDNVSIST